MPTAKEIRKEALAKSGTTLTLANSALHLLELTNREFKLARIRNLASPNILTIMLARKYGSMPQLWREIATFHPMAFGLEDPFIMEQIV